VRYRTVVNLVTGAVVVMFGLGYLGWIRLPFERLRSFGSGLKPFAQDDNRRGQDNSKRSAQDDNKERLTDFRRDDNEEGAAGLDALPQKSGEVPPRGRRGGFIGSVVFGVTFSVAWTPCVGTFLGSALMLAANRGSWAQGVALLVCYSLGLGIPLVVSAVVVDGLKGSFDAIKRHYETVTRVSGALLVLVGLLMMSGRLSVWLTVLSG
jgi:cytochrome c biogenesis protein CcdA